MELIRLIEPFPAEEVKWLEKKKGAGKMAYLRARAIYNRLDDVCGQARWKTDYRAGPCGGIMAGIGIEIAEGKWVWKWDGAENTNFEAVKGGISAAIKRAAVHWGIGRYLYYLPKGCKKLPEWALPGGSGRPGTAIKSVPKKKAAPKETAQPSEETIGKLMEAFVNMGCFQVDIARFLAKPVKEISGADIEYLRKEYAVLREMNDGDRKSRILEWGGA